MLKYLYGKLPVASKLNGGQEERMGRASALLFSVRRNAYQHKEMAFDACFIAFNGGFSNFNPNLKERHFYGESISCLVETDESIIDKLIELKQTGRVFYTKAVDNKQKLFVIIEGENIYPRKTERTGNWIPCSLEEMQELCDVERFTLPFKYRKETMFKYLAGWYFIKEDEGVCQSLLLTVKRDSYQHSDMARNFGYIPSVGGFAALQKETPNEMFFGKSVSCNVTTSKEHNLILMELVKNGNIFHCSTYKVKDVWLFLEKDYTPDPDEGVEFKQVTMEEFKARTDELIKDPYYF